MVTEDLTLILLSPLPTHLLPAPTVAIPDADEPANPLDRGSGVGALLWASGLTPCGTASGLGVIASLLQWLHFGGFFFFF